MNKSWHDYIKVDDLPEDYQLAAEAIGLENVIKLAEKLPKVYLYLKDPERLFIAAKRQFILDTHKTAGPDNPWRPRLVALAAGCSIDFVYKTINDAHETAKQGDLFETG